MAPGRQPAAADGVAAAADEHQSLALPVLIAQLGRGGKSRVLDLGPALGSNVAFFSGRPCSLYIADLPHSLFADGMPAIQRRRGAFAALLARELPRDQRFDLILTWDLPNYLELDEIGDLSRHLALISNPGASLFALVATHKSMPSRPAVFHIAAPDRLNYDLEASPHRPAPMYKEPDLRRAMVDFEIETTYLLRNGMQEYLFSRRSGLAGE